MINKGYLLIPTMLLAFGITTKSLADFATATYTMGGDHFDDSNNNPPVFPSTTVVRSTFTFTFDRLNSENAIVPDSVQGIAIRDNNGTLHVYDETAAGVKTAVNPFLETARITFGGNVNTPEFMVGLSNDFRVIFDIDTTTGAVTNIQEKLAYVSTVDPFYTASSFLLVLTSFEVETADLDNDGDVDGADFLLIQRTDPALIPLWESQYGTTNTVAVSQAVPEPPTFLLLLAVILGFNRRISLVRSLAD